MSTRWVESFVVLVVLIGWIVVHYDWPGGRQLRTGLLATWAWAGANPATATLWVLVALHCWMLAGLPNRLGQQVLRVHSTNLAALGRDPVTVLFASAMWTDISDLLTLTVTALLVLGPAERWLGTARMVGVFLTGHIGATLLTAIWLEYQIAHGHLSPSIARTVDVGVSYGTWCTAAVLCYRLPMRWRLLGFAALAAYFVTVYVENRTFTDLGHCLSVAIGVLLYPLTRAESVRARAAGRWIRVPVLPATG
ncbi:rhomboid-like protein [Kitasatospora sp. NPDC052896]|uniref:rhomboid-like protein n=1 Tax=Kitasatospora sp. NPDC052896 TaxID=3364061 RepID=UPI0037C98EF6